ncbi:MAG TPA: flavin reductase family protein [Candidatus Edwardsbacteria bacterium]|nr:flavin reductase family protein [Candidatus Edwardsbacteria bacterium]
MAAIDQNVFQYLTYGMYVVASYRQGKLNGQVADVVFQVAAEPPLIAVSLNCQNLTHELIAQTKRFSVSVLAQDAPLKFIGIFGFKCGRSVEKYSGINYKVLPSGTPVILDHCLGWLDLEVTQAVELGTHTLFIGRVVASEVIAPGEPMTYAHYHKIKGGMTQVNAPTYVKPQ